MKDPRPKRALVVFNPAAGRRRRAALAEALDHFRRKGVVTTVRETEAPGDAERIAAEATAGRCDVVVAAGGDGTLNEVLNGLGADAPPLAVLPLGTANVLAVELGLPRRIEAVVDIIAEGRTRPFWPGIVNGRRFALMAGVGVDAMVVDAVGVRQKRFFGRYAYAGQALLAIARGGFSGYVLDVDGSRVEAGSAIVTLGSHYGGSYVLAPSASLFRPELLVCILRGCRRRDHLRYAAALLRGRLADQPDVRIIPARRIAIGGPAAAPVQCDGNIVCRLPVTFTLADRPVALVVPAVLAEP